MAIWGALTNLGLNQIDWGLIYSSEEEITGSLLLREVFFGWKLPYPTIDIHEMGETIVILSDVDDPTTTEPISILNYPMKYWTDLNDDYIPFHSILVEQTTYNNEFDASCPKDVNPLSTGRFIWRSFPFAILPRQSDLTKLPPE